MHVEVQVPEGYESVWNEYTLNFSEFLKEVVMPQIVDKIHAIISGSGRKVK